MSELLEISPEKLQDFEFHDSQRHTFTYPRINLQTEATRFYPHEVDISTRLTRGIRILSPFVSAPMSTVTESAMAIAMAKQGGVGVIHMGLSPERQAEEVFRVKDEVKNFVDEPKTFSVSQTINEVRNIIYENGWHFDSFPVLDDNGKFAGLLTKKGIERTLDDGAPVFDQMKQRDGVLDGKAGTSIEEAYHAMMTDPEKRSRMVIVNEGQEVVGMYLYSDVKRAIDGESSGYNVDKRGSLITVAALPTSRQALERVRLMNGKLDVGVFDSSDGDSPYAFEAYKLMREEYPDLQIMSANIISRKSAKLLAEGLLVDAIRTGQGGSPICTTRDETANGLAQFTAVYRTALGVGDAIKANPEAVDASGRNLHDIPVCADGAIKKHADPSKAIVALAESTMMGTSLAGVTESPGEVIVDEYGNRKKRHRGMGSSEEFDNNPDAQARYKNEGRKRPNPEGIATFVPYLGALATVLTPYKELLAKSMYQCNARTIDEHRMNTMFNAGDESTEREAATLQPQ